MTHRIEVFKGRFTERKWLKLRDIDFNQVIIGNPILFEQAFAQEQRDGFREEVLGGWLLLFSWDRTIIVFWGSHIIIDEKTCLDLEFVDTLVQRSQEDICQRVLSYEI